MLLYTTHISISIYCGFDFNSHVFDLHFIMVDSLHIVLLSIIVKWWCSGLYCVYVLCCLFHIIEVIIIAFDPWSITQWSMDCPLFLLLVFYCCIVINKGMTYVWLYGTDQMIYGCKMYLLWLAPYCTVQSYYYFLLLIF